MPTIVTTIESPLGPLTLMADDGCLTGLSMHDQRHALVPPADTVRDDNWFVPVVDQLHNYFTGDLARFDVPLRFGGTDFQRKVWSSLLDIPYGETISYSELAQRVGSPRACRAVGLANGRNPIALIVPCHRVIGASGRLTGYGGGLERKSWLLDHEACHRPGLVSPASGGTERYL